MTFDNKAVSVGTTTSSLLDYMALEIERAIAKARREERERCAKVARNYGAYEVERQIHALEDEK